MTQIPGKVSVIAIFAGYYLVYTSCRFYFLNQAFDHN